ncbi:MAG: polyprenyl synthetase family protein [Haliangium ochraceum]
MTADAAGALEDWITAHRRLIESAIEIRLPARARADDPGRLVEAMRYSLLSPGKRLRPLLALAAAEAIVGRGGPALTGERGECLIAAAAAVEAVHCYSLIHDDLPAMDDDDLRRGKPSNHKVFGEATAILAGDALLTLAFEWLAEAGVRSGHPQDFGRAALALARGAGQGGMVRGQARDLGEPAPDGLAALETLHLEKTAALFRAAVQVGAAAAGATASQIDALGVFGTCFGVAFQHADDRDDGDHGAHAAAVGRRVPELLAEAMSALDALPSPSANVGVGARADAAAILRAIAGQLLTRTVAPTDLRRATDNQS